MIGTRFTLLKVDQLLYHILHVKNQNTLIEQSLKNQSPNRQIVQSCIPILELIYFVNASTIIQL